MKIEINSNPRLALVWKAYDGDDCFDIHYAEIIEDYKRTRYDFGPCAVKMCRKVVFFFEDEKLNEVSLGFRNPDIIYYKIIRSGGMFEFEVDFNKRNEKYIYSFDGKFIRIDKAFLSKYYW